MIFCIAIYCDTIYILYTLYYQYCRNTGINFFWTNWYW